VDAPDGRIKKFIQPPPSKGRAGPKALPFLFSGSIGLCYIFRETQWSKEETAVQEEAIINRLKEVAKEGKISCAMAMRIAADFNVTIKKVGELLNQNKIKIIQCQLGCF
jgi:hypothetical protein